MCEEGWNFLREVVVRGWLKQGLQEEEEEKILERYREVINTRESSPPPPSKVGTEEGVSGFSL